MKQHMLSSSPIHRADKNSFTISKMTAALRRTVAEAAEQLDVKKSEFHAVHRIVEAMNVTMQQDSMVFYLDVGVVLLVPWYRRVKPSRGGWGVWTVVLMPSLFKDIFAWQQGGGEPVYPNKYNPHQHALTAQQERRWRATFRGYP